ncbi:DUF599 family protein [Mesorhizobium sp. CAU 1741]|uniref:DUF599 domain-containing protein n=1 Tax=Mesorhizobium sp. CAU 1741 TaxID=3140366 RepID=UPI00325B9277
MLLDSLLRDPTDIAALAFFLLGWVAYAQAVQGRIISRVTLTTAMDHQRERWMRTMARRELRMVDTGIMSGLQQGTAFFASSCLLAIGGCFALLGSTEAVLGVLSDLPATDAMARPAFEAKVLGLIAILSYAFFKFGWSYRLFNYCSILIGAVPLPGETSETETELEVMRAARMNILAGKHFNAGLRGVFFSIGYLGWFVGPWVFMATTLFILCVLVRRQFFSAARRATLNAERL